jgi:hypothetical protein
MMRPQMADTRPSVRIMANVGVVGGIPAAAA